MMSKIWNGVTTIVMVAMLLLAAVLFLPKLVHIEPLIVLSGSMEPEYKVGSVVYVQETDPQKVKVGDVITFYLTGDTVVTHRVTAVDSAAEQFTTKGDANKSEDGTPVDFDSLIGVPVISVPYLGYLADKMSTTSGKILYVTLIIVVLLLMYMGDVIWSEEKKAEVRDEKKNQQ